MGRFLFVALMLLAMCDLTAAGDQWGDKTESVAEDYRDRGQTTTANTEAAKVISATANQERPVSLGVAGYAQEVARTADPVPAARERPRLGVQMGHSVKVTSVSLSGDGKWLVTGSEDRSARLWEVATGKEIRAFRGHSLLLTSVSLSRDGKWLGTGSWDKTARLWEVATGKEVRTFRGHSKEVSAVSLSGDGKWLVTGCWDNTARLWEIATGKEVRVFRGQSGITSVSLSNDNKWLVTGNFDNTARLWEVATGKETQTFRGHSDAVTSVSLSAGGRWLVTGSDDKTARLWEATTGKEIRTFRGHDRKVTSVSLSGDGKWLATGSEDFSARFRLWDAATGKEVRALLEIQPADWRRAVIATRGSCVTLSGDGKWLATGSFDKTALLWEMATGKQVRTFRGHSDVVSCVALSGDGQWLVTASGDELRHSGADNTARLWEAATGMEVRAFQGHSDMVTSVSLSGDSKWLATGSQDKTARLWEVATGKQVRAFRGHGSEVTSVRLSGDGRWLVTGSKDDTARLWEVATGREVRIFRGHSAEVRSVSLSADGRWLVTGSFDNTARLWEVATGKEIRAFRGHTFWVDSVSLSEDGKWLVTGSGWDATARLWEVATGKEVRTFHCDARCVSLSGDSKRLVTGGSTTACLWEAATGKEVRTFQGHSDQIESVALSGDGRRMLTGSSDGTTRLWDVVKGKQLCSLVTTQGGGITVTPDNYYVASKGALDAVAFCVGNHAFAFEQFDLKYNRPDKVLESIGLASPEMVTAYRHVYRKRLKRMNFTEEMLGDDYHLPEVVVLSELPPSTPNKSITLRGRASDAKYRLDRLNVYVNGVPLHSVDGIGLRDKNVRAWEQDFEIELSAGKNSIQVSALNDKGAESLRETRDIVCEAPASKPDLYVVVVGVSAYQDERYRLTYADKDANDLAEYLKTRTENYRQVHLTQLVNQKATRDNILKVKQLLRRSRVDDQVIVFFSGHGLLDDKLDYYFATADMDFRKPSAKGVSYEEIEGLLDGIRARKKLLLMDTCHSGEVDKDETKVAVAEKFGEGEVKGRTIRGGLQRVLRDKTLGLTNSLRVQQELFADLRRGSGAVVISAAGGMEFALESREWNNGVFTYALLRGLKDKQGDRNKDGLIQVSELRTYVLDEVRRLTRDRQAPTVRMENLKFDYTVD